MPPLFHDLIHPHRCTPPRRSPAAHQVILTTPRPRSAAYRSWAGPPKLPPWMWHGAPHEVVTGLWWLLPVIFEKCMIHQCFWSWCKAPPESRWRCYPYMSSLLDHFFEVGSATACDLKMRSRVVDPLTSPRFGRQRSSVQTVFVKNTRS
jgi:hypothetical protein